MGFFYEYDEETDTVRKAQEWRELEDAIDELKAALWAEIGPPTQALLEGVCRLVQRVPGRDRDG